jgi:hypothetical protein
MRIAVCGVPRPGMRPGCMYAQGLTRATVYNHPRGGVYDHPDLATEAGPSSSTNAKPGPRSGRSCAHTRTEVQGARWRRRVCRSRCALPERKSSGHRQAGRPDCGMSGMAYTRTAA